ncbi:DUF3095 domain-containing protein [Chitinophaga rhizophila]|uniref:DUF3095 domain-containing protein n=1 Tax=Chitinophaga rhizophila TaxID=2866212 RepID=A0ABS7G6U9_9BACT|nr:DUF3095 domain-containing protein [Chitinophaga rhizophila]MBW8683349.1 DUF3095 domain-containing protein [Chitinophaga rhizophila]
MSLNNDQFYSRLPVNRIPLSELLTEAHLFYHVPEDWHVIITDIRGSTAVVQSGLHETVNLVATGSIVAVLNISFRANITVPFFFGGDGATFIVPASIKDTAIKALLLYKKNTQESFDIDLRIGTVAVRDIYAAGHTLRITKFNSSGNFHIPVILGNGLNYAEKQIKGEDYLLPGDFLPDNEVDLTGMQCRWDKIKPPESHYEVVSLIVVSTAEETQSAVFREVITHIDTIYGLPEKRQPISIPQLRLKSTFTKLGLELRARFGRKKFVEQMKTWLTNLLGRLYFRTKSGRTYLSRLVEMSDTLVIDGKINTVIAGTEAQRQELVTQLNILENAGRILYAFYASKESVMSCYVRDYKDEHIHFVDGAEGGYTKAAGVLKLKFVHLSA